MDKVFMGVVLEEIKGIVKDNGRNIADANLRIMALTDKVDDVKEDTRTMSEVIAEIQEDVNTMIKLNNEQMKLNREMRESSQNISVLLEQILSIQKEMRKDMDTWKNRDREYLKVGVM